VASPYSPVYEAGEWRCVSGQIGITADGLADSFGEQTDAMLANFAALLREHGLEPAQVAKTTVFLSDMADYAELNERYAAFFGDHRPARSAVAVSELPFGALIEMEAWVHVPG